MSGSSGSSGSSNVNKNAAERKIYQAIQAGVRENLKHDILGEKDVKVLRGLIDGFIRQKRLLVVGDEAIKFYRSREYREIELRDLNKIKNLPITVHVYSPYAISDAKELGELIKERGGYEHVAISEIAEYKTYVLDVEFKTVVKFSYINSRVFRNIPYIEARGRGGVRYITPEYLLVGLYYKYITPRISVREWKSSIEYEKALFDGQLFRERKVRGKAKERGQRKRGRGKGQQNGTFGQRGGEKTLFKKAPSVEHSEAMASVIKYLGGREDCLLTGLMAYNLMILGMKGGEDDRVDNVGYLSVMCDGLDERVAEIKKLVDGMGGIDKVEETQPLLIYFGEGRKLYMGGRLLVELIELPTCFNYNEVSGVKVANFHQIVWFLLLQRFFEKRRDVNDYYRTLIKRLIDMRVRYLDAEGMSGLEKGVTQVFGGNCVGPNVNYKFLYHLDFWEGTRRYRHRF